jgi:hypothetical protein
MQKKNWHHPVIALISFPESTYKVLLIFCLKFNFCKYFQNNFGGNA